MRLARSGLGPEPSPSVVEPLEEAERELRTALAELRDVAHGIFPAVLADEGLAAALEAFTEEAAVPVELRVLPDGDSMHRSRPPPTSSSRRRSAGQAE